MNARIIRQLIDKIRDGMSPLEYKRLFKGLRGAIEKSLGDVEDVEVCLQRTIDFQIDKLHQLGLQSWFEDPLGESFAPKILHRRPQIEALSKNYAELAYENAKGGVHYHDLLRILQEMLEEVLDKFESLDETQLMQILDQITDVLYVFEHVNANITGDRLRIIRAEIESWKKALLYPCEFKKFGYCVLIHVCSSEFIMDDFVSCSLISDKNHNIYEVGDRRQGYLLRFDHMEIVGMCPYDANTALLRGTDEFTQYGLALTYPLYYDRDMWTYWHAAKPFSIYTPEEMLAEDCLNEVVIRHPVPTGVVAILKGDDHDEATLENTKRVAEEKGLSFYIFDKRDGSMVLDTIYPKLW